MIQVGIERKEIIGVLECTKEPSLYFCHTLKDDGVGYGDYLEQLTYLLFLKMAHEFAQEPYLRESRIPRGYDWASLRGRTGGGTFNAGRYSNPQLDALIDAIRTEPDITRRRARVGVALRLIQDDLPLLPLYRRKLNWAMASRVQVVPWPNDMLELRWVRLR